jgi:hypothetical protein
VPIKEVILSLNNSRPEADKFILEDLDETRLLVKANCLDWLREELAKFQNKNTYEVTCQWLISTDFSNTGSIIFVRAFLTSREVCTACSLHGGRTAFEGA